MKTKQIALFGMLVALAFVFSYVEHLIPLPLPTGIKLGAANIVVLCTLYFLGWKEAAAVSVIRILLSGFMFGIGTLPYSMAGGICSLAVMVLLKRSSRFGMLGVSVAGGVCHNIGQILVAMALLGSKTGYYFPLLFFGGICAGILIGLLSGWVLKKMEKHLG